MDRGINNNGFEYVDLELPSGTLWATMNVGASKSTDFGLYFQWGDTQGYTANQVGIGSVQKKFAIEWNDYKWGEYKKFTKYTKLGGKLELEDDAAHVNMGGDWHMPAPKQIRELLDNTITSWETLEDGIEGVKFTSKKDASKTIFIPIAGNAWDGSVHGSRGYGGVWSSALYTNNAISGQYLFFNSSYVYLSHSCRSNGYSVRGVIG